MKKILAFIELDVNGDDELEMVDRVITGEFFPHEVKHYYVCFENGGVHRD